MTAYTRKRGTGVRSIFGATLIGLGVTLVFSPAPARADARAEALLSRAAETLRAAKTLRAEFTATSLFPSRYRDTQERGTVTLARPGSARIEIDRFRKPERGDDWKPTGNGSTLVSDGETVHTLIRHPNGAQHRAAPSDESLAERLLEEIEPVRGFFAGGSPKADGAQYLGSKTWQGAPYEVVEVRGGATRPDRGTAVRELWIGSDGVIRRAITRFEVQGRPASREVTLRNVRLNAPVKADTFALRVPADAAPFQRAAAQPLLAAGADAPEIAAQDISGKPVRLADYRGKVVVLKFWATWCWPCNLSLPHTQALAQKYGDDVAVLAVTIWDTLKALKAWQGKHPEYGNIRFTLDPAPQGDADGSAAWFHIGATPTEYVIGRDGRVAAAFSGYDGPTDRLDRAVRAALDAPSHKPGD